MYYNYMEISLAKRMAYYLIQLKGGMYYNIFYFLGVKL